VTNQTDDALIAEYIRIDDFVKQETKRFGEHLAPHRARMEEIANQLLSILNERKSDSTKCDSGTAYKSTLLNVKVEDQEKFLDLCLEDWDTRGDMLQIGVLKEPIRRWMDSHEGKPPDGTSISWFTRCNIRRS
jgi:hypothetical protein